MAKKQELEEIEEELDEDVYTSSLQIGGDIHKQTAIFEKEFLHLPKEVKYAFYDKRDLYNMRFKSKLFLDYKYFKKIISWSSLELLELYKVRKKMYEISDEKKLKEYLKSINKQYIYDGLQSYDLKERAEILSDIKKQINEAKEMEIVETLYPSKSIIQDVLDDYKQNNPLNENVDTWGILNDMFTITETSKGYKGQERKSINTTISENRNIDEVRDNEEDSPDESVGGFKGMMKGFKKKQNNYSEG